MIRRSPTRIELKLDDLQDFDYIQKCDKKKTPSTGVTVQEAQKLLRQERIGFRPLRSSTSGIPGVVFPSGGNEPISRPLIHPTLLNEGGQTIAENGNANNGNATNTTTPATTSAGISTSNAVNVTQLTPQANTTTPAVLDAAGQGANTTTPANTPDTATSSAVDMSMSMSFDD